MKKWAAKQTSELANMGGLEQDKFHFELNKEQINGSCAKPPLRGWLVANNDLNNVYSNMDCKSDFVCNLVIQV